MADAATLQILIQIRDELAGLTRTRQGIADTKKEAEGFGKLLKEGLGIGTGMAIATGAIELLKDAIIETVHHAIELSTQIQHGSEELEITTTAYQVLRLQLMHAGIDMSRLNIAFTEQTRTMAEARDISSAAATAYRTLGLDIEKLEEMPFDQRLMAIVVAMQSATDKTMAFQAASQILGARGLPQLLGALRELGPQYRQVTEEMKAAGQIADAEDTRRVEEAKRKYEAFKNWILVQTIELAGGFLHQAQSTPWTVAGEAVAAQKARIDRELHEVFGGIDARVASKSDTNPLEKTTEWRKKELDLSYAQAKAALAAGDASLGEAEKRDKLIAALEQQLKLENDLADLTERKLVPGENAEDRYKLEASLYQKIAALQQQIAGLKIEAGQGAQPANLVSRINRQDKFDQRNDPNKNPDFLGRKDGVVSGMQDYLISLGSTGQIVSQTLQQSLGQAVSGIASDIWDAEKGTKSWGDAFRNLGDMAGRMLTELLVKLAMVELIEAALGWLGGGGKGTVTAGTTAGGGKKLAGGGTFITTGPESITVGDNPGGMELVSVRPLSGVGQSTFDGQALRMGGGGTVLVGSGMSSGAPIVVSITQHNALGLSGAIRAELVGMTPTLKKLAVDAVQEAQMRNRLRI